MSQTTDTHSVFCQCTTDQEVMWVLDNISGKPLQPKKKDIFYSPESSTSVSLSLNHEICGGGFPEAVHETSMVSPILVV